MHHSLRTSPQPRASVLLYIPGAHPAMRGVSRLVSPCVAWRVPVTRAGGVGHREVSERPLKTFRAKRPHGMRGLNCTTLAAWKPYEVQLSLLTPRAVHPDTEFALRSAAFYLSVLFLLLDGST